MCLEPVLHNQRSHHTRESPQTAKSKHNQKKNLKKERWSRMGTQFGIQGLRTFSSVVASLVVEHRL